MMEHKYMEELTLATLSSTDPVGLVLVACVVLMAMGCEISLRNHKQECHDLGAEVVAKINPGNYKPYDLEKILEYPAESSNTPPMDPIDIKLAEEARKTIRDAVELCKPEDYNKFGMHVHNWIETSVEESRIQEMCENFRSAFADIDFVAIVNKDFPLNMLFWDYYTSWMVNTNLTQTELNILDAFNSILS